MKILMLSDVYFPRVNGVSTSIKTFRDDLRRLGHQCVLVAPEYPVAAEAPDDPEILRIPSWQVPFDPEDRLLSWSALKKWTDTLAPGSFDIVTIKDADSNSFATRFENIFVFGKAEDEKLAITKKDGSSLISMPKGRGVAQTILQEQQKRLSQEEQHKRHQ